MEPPRAAMSAPRVGRCLRCDMELPFVAFSRSQQNKLRAKKEAGDVSRIEPLSESVVCPPRFISALGSGWLAAAGGNVPKLR